MKVTTCAVGATLLCAVLTATAEPAADPSPAAQRVPEPNVQRTVIEDDANRVEQLNVRGQPRSIVVTTKGVLPGTYEIHMGDPSRDLGSSGGTPRGAIGQRMWRVLSF